ncbi:hypothetical protein EDB92DRAFT_1852115 [Lactarius akahatsu]|uniref:Uncharacterized protein n=1 Tax=Lactarius akahatsu TaxID=416441 RepID=A0AAD4QEQ7_9AGAM|nr:hypothetical protein EDB92DRAFT_1852115 [Lactarius akahatsu]
MNPWTTEEISKAAVIHGLSASDPYHQYGPTPRICLDFLDDEALFLAHKASYQAALCKFSLETLDDTVFQIMKLSLDDESHTLLLVKRVPRKDLIRANLVISDRVEFVYGCSEPITHTIKLELRNRLQKETRAARIALYRSLGKLEGTRRWTRCIASLVYESLAQSMLEEKVALKLFPMVKRESSGLAKERSCLNGTLITETYLAWARSKIRCTTHRKLKIKWRSIHSL